MSLGEVISKFRVENNLTLNQIGEAFGVSRQAVHKWEQDESIPTLENVLRPLANGGEEWAKKLAFDMLNAHAFFTVLIPKNSTETEA